MPSSARRTSSGRMPPIGRHRRRRRQHRAVGTAQHQAAAAALQREQVHRRRADEARGEARRGRGIHHLRRRILLDATVAQQNDLIRHAHRLGLIVRDVQHGDAQTALQRQNLPSHIGAQLGVQIRQRLIHQADRRLGDDGAAERDTLLLAAGQLSRLAMQQRSDAEDVHGAGEAASRVPAAERAWPSVRTRCSRRLSDAGTARRTGTPWRRRARRAADA